MTGSEIVENLLLSHRDIYQYLKATNSYADKWALIEKEKIKRPNKSSYAVINLTISMPIIFTTLLELRAVNYFRGHFSKRRQKEIGSKSTWLWEVDTGRWACHHTINDMMQGGAMMKCREAVVYTSRRLVFILEADASIKARAMSRQQSAIRQAWNRIGYDIDWLPRTYCSKFSEYQYRITEFRSTIIDDSVVAPICMLSG